MVAAWWFRFLGDESRLIPFDVTTYFWPSPLPGYRLFTNPHALPRAYVVYRTRAAPGPEVLLGLLSRDDFDPMAESFVEDAGALPPTLGPPRVGHALSFLRDDEAVVELDANLEAPGVVVLADTFYPGWKATVDGAAVPIYPTNYLFRSVPVPAGMHRVRFAYRPASVPLGAVLSGVGVAILAALALWPPRATRGPRDEPSAPPGGGCHSSLARSV